MTAPRKGLPSSPQHPLACWGVPSLCPSLLAHAFDLDTRRQHNTFIAAITQHHLSWWTCGTLGAELGDLLHQGILAFLQLSLLQFQFVHIVCQRCCLGLQLNRFHNKQQGLYIPAAYHSSSDHALHWEADGKCWQRHRRVSRLSLPLLIGKFIQVKNTGSIPKFNLNIVFSHSLGFANRSHLHLTQLRCTQKLQLCTPTRRQSQRKEPNLVGDIHQVT